MIAYFDASALVKLVIDEPGSEDAGALWDGADAVVSSRVANAEVRAALAAARRAARLGDDAHTDTKRLWSGYWGSLRLVELDADVSDRAGNLAELRALSGFDAVHLASAATTDVGPDELVLATWDRRLHDAAAAEGLAAFPRDL